MSVFVRPPGLRPNAEGKEREFWVALIVEIKARDPTSVYALVAWFYWADQLEGAHMNGEEPRDGRRGYHGKDELLASNHLDVCNVQSFAGEAPVAQWDEGDDENDVQTGLYWRQTYDCRTGELSVCVRLVWKLEFTDKAQQLRRHCGCESFYNPDTLMLGCPNPACLAWLHLECAVDDLLSRAYDRLLLGEGGSEKNPRSYSNRLEGTVIKGGNKVRIDDLETKRTFTSTVRCLRCKTLFA